MLYVALKQTKKTKEQKKDFLEKSRILSCTVQLKSVLFNFLCAFDLEGLLFIETKAVGSGNATLMLVAPAPVRTDIMRMAHDSVMSGHLDRGKTMSRVR